MNVAENKIKVKQKKNITQKIIVIKVFNGITRNSFLLQIIQKVVGYK